MKIAIICVIIPVILANPFRPFEIEKRMVGGDTIDITASPSTVYVEVNVQYLLSFLGILLPFVCKFSCTGSIIGPHSVVTAGHCTQQKNPVEMTFDCIGFGLPGLLGGQTVSPSAVTITAYSTTHSAVDGTPFSVTKVITHPQYNAKNFDFDVGLFKTVDSFRPNAIIPVATTAPQPGDAYLASGWGKTSGTGSPSAKLKQGILYIISKADCQPAFTSTNITNQMICAQNKAANVATCNGDSGGPLTNTLNGFLAALTSFGIIGCDSANPSVFASLIPMRPFLIDNDAIPMVPIIN